MIEYPGTVAYSWKTRSMNVADQEGVALYQVSPSGTITGFTPLNGSTDIVQGTIKGGRFIGPDVENGDVEIYAYPAGGVPQSTIGKYVSEPVGSATSPEDGSD
jgi:hypothetical protein